MRNYAIVTIFSVTFGLLIGSCVNIGSDRAVSETSKDVWVAMGAPPAEKRNARHEWCLAFRDGLMVVTEYAERRAQLETAFQDCIKK